MIHMPSLIDDTKGCETVRAVRWSDGVRCPACARAEVTQHGRDDTQPERQRDLGKACSRHVDDLTDTIVAGHQQPLRVWMVCLYVRGLHLSNAPMAKARDLQPADVQQRTCPWRHGMVAKPPSPTVSHAVEGDEVYLGRWPPRPARCSGKQGRCGRRRRLRGTRGRGTLATEKPPSFGLIQRGGEVVIRRLEHVPHVTITPRIHATMAPGTCVHTDAYDM